MTTFESFVVQDAEEQRSVGNIKVPFILSPPSPMNAQEASDFVKNHEKGLDKKTL